MSKRGTKQKNEGAALRDDLAAIQKLTHRMRKSLITDMAEMEWENEESGLSCLHTVAAIAADLIEIEIKTGELMQRAG